MTKHLVPRGQRARRAVFSGVGAVGLSCALLLGHATNTTAANIVVDLANAVIGAGGQGNPDSLRGRDKRRRQRQLGVGRTDRARHRALGGGNPIQLLAQRRIAGKHRFHFSPILFRQFTGLIKHQDRFAIEGVNE